MSDILAATAPTWFRLGVQIASVSFDHYISHASGDAEDGSLNAFFTCGFDKP